MIALHSCTKSFSTPEGPLVLYENVDRSVDNGDFVTIMGPSGSGKSTLFHLCAGLDTPDSGDVVVGGTVISSLNDDERAAWRAKTLGFIFQQFRLIPHLTVEENIDLAIDLMNVPRRFETADLLDRVGLVGKRRSYPHQLSGGEQQRVGIARACVADKQLIFADEPTASLDTRNAHRVMELLKDLQQTLSLTIVMITHDQTMATYASKIYTIEGKTLVRQ